MAESLKWRDRYIEINGSDFVTKQDIEKKQDKLKVGTGITITKDPVTGEDVISCTATGDVTEARVIEILDAYCEEIVADEIAALFEGGGSGGGSGGGGSSISEIVTAEVTRQIANLDLSAYLKKENLKAGNSINISEEDGTGKTIVSFNGQAGGISEDRAREIANEQISGGNFATKDEIPQNISDLNNDAGFVKEEDLSPVAKTGSYDDITNTPDPYDDTAIQNAISDISGKVTDLENKTNDLEDKTTGLENKTNELENKTNDIEETVAGLSGQVLPPVIKQPKLSISGTNIDKDIEIGSTSNETITLTFDKGAISSGGTTAGDAIEYSLNDGAYQTSNVFNVVVSDTNKTFKGKVRHAAGDQPKDSSGANYGDPLPEGVVESDVITYNFVQPVVEEMVELWSNAANILSVVKEAPVKKSAGEYIFSFAPQTEENPEIFDVPADITILKVETINDITGAWASVENSFDITDVTHDGVAYKRYTDNREYDDDGRDIKITWQ